MSTPRSASAGVGLQKDSLRFIVPLRFIPHPSKAIDPRKYSFSFQWSAIERVTAHQIAAVDMVIRHDPRPLRPSLQPVQLAG